MRMPSASRTSAEPLRDVMARLPCLATGTPVDATTSAEAVEILNVADGRVETRPVDAAALGLGAAPTSALAGGSAEDNAAIVEAIFAGETGPRRDVVLLNAGAALVAAGTAADLREGIEAAAATLDAGKPAELLARLPGS